MFKLGSKTVSTPTGLPFIWNTGDSTTATSGRVVSTGVNYGEELGISVAVGSGRVFAGYAGLTSIAIYNGLDGQSFTRIDQYKTPSASPAVSSYLGYNMKFRNGYLALSDDFYNSAGAISNEGRVVLTGTDGATVYKTYKGSISNGQIGSACISIGSGRVAASVLKHNTTFGFAIPTYVDVFDLSTANNSPPLKTLLGSVDERFGTSVDVNEGRIAVGATTNSVGGEWCGAVHIFNTDGTLIKSKYGTQSYAGFGRSVAIGNGIIAVGAPDDLNYKGSVTLFDLDGNYIRKITCPDDVEHRRFGYGVAVGSGRLFVGSPCSQSNGPADERFGFVYVFDLDGKLIERIDAPTTPTRNAGMFFGYKVEVNEDVLAVGAPFWNASATGMVCMYRTPWNVTVRDIPELISVGQEV